MQSVLTVVTPADSQDLTILANVKTELNITDASEDARIESWIDQASGACAAYCNRVFGKETVTETFRNRRSYTHRRNALVASIELARIPVASVPVVTEDGVPLTVDVDFEYDPEKGFLYRLDPNADAITNWDFNKLVVTYDGGYELIGDLPYNVERACITQTAFLRESSGRDVGIKSENIPGVLSTTYWQSGSTDNGAMPPEVTALLDPFRNVAV